MSIIWSVHQATKTFESHCHVILDHNETEAGIYLNVLYSVKIHYFHTL